MEINYKLTSDGQELKDSRYQFKYISLGYKMNNYPTFSLTLKKILSTDDENSNDTKYDFLKYKNLDIDIKSEQFNFNSELGVNNIFAKTLDSIVIQGYLCNSKMFDRAESKYLGNTTQDAIRSLGFKQDLSVGNLGKDFFQLNETAIKCLDTILTGAGEKTSYFITENSIRTVRLESLYRDTSMKGIRVQFDSIQYDPMFDIGDRVVDKKVNVASDQVGGNGHFNVNNSYAEELINLHNDAFVRNVTSNLIYQQGYNLYISIPNSQVGNYEDGTPIELGDIVYLPYVDLPTLRYMVTGVDKVFSQTGLSIKLTIQTLRLS